MQSDCNLEASDGFVRGAVYDEAHPGRHAGSEDYEPAARAMMIAVQTARSVLSTQCTCLKALDRYQCLDCFLPLPSISGTAEESLSVRITDGTPALGFACQK
jgi:hypothetical protein